MCVYVCIYIFLMLKLTENEPTQRPILTALG